jgi:hypothetical protein
MKCKVLAYIIIIFLTACQSREIDEWHLLDKSDYNTIEIYILKHPDSNYLEQAIEKVIELKLNADTTTIPPTIPAYYGRNAVRIFVDNNEIIWEKYYESQSIEINSIYDFAIEFFTNSQYDTKGTVQEYLPETQDRIIISRGIFFLIFNADSKESTKREVISQLSNAIMDYKENLKNEYINNFPENKKDEYLNLIDEHLQHRIWIFSRSQIQRRENE